MGDCYFVSSLGEVALKDPAAIENMISSNGNGTYSVRFFVNGKPDYVTVNSELPVMTGYGWANGSKLEFANGTADDWVALVEKAYAQLNAQTSAPHGMQLDSASDSYAGITAGNGSALTLITDQSETAANLSPRTSASSLALIMSNLASSFRAGEEILMSTPASSSGNLVGDHMYMVIGVNASTGALTIHNPWNTAYSGSLAMSFNETIQQLAADSCTLWVTSGSPVTTSASDPPAAPTVAITSAGALDDAATQTIAGTIDVADAGATVDIYDGTSLIGATTANSSGNWSASVPLSGAGLHALTARATDLSGLTGVSDAKYLATAGGQTVNFADASGDAASLYDTAGAWDAVYGSKGTAYLNGAQAVVTGSGDVITFSGGSADVVSLTGTANDWDWVSASNGSVYLNGAQTVVSGGGNSVDFATGSANAVSLTGTANAWDWVNASNGTVNLNGAQTVVAGGGDTIDFATGSANAATLTGTANAWDWVTASNGTAYLDGAQTVVAGGGNTIDFAGGSGDAVSLTGTANAWDWVNASNGTVYIDSAQTVVAGGGNSITFSGGSGDAVGLTGTANTCDWVTASNGTVDLNGAQAVVAGSSDTINFAGTSATVLNGGSDALSFQQGIGGQDLVSGFGSSELDRVEQCRFCQLVGLVEPCFAVGRECGDHTRSERHHHLNKCRGHEPDPVTVPFCVIEAALASRSARQSGGLASGARR